MDIEIGAKVLDAALDIDVTAKGRLPRKGMFRRRGARGLELLQASATEWAGDFGPLFVAGISGKELVLILFPWNGFIWITAGGFGITARFMSTQLGAGFHVAAVDLLEHLGQRHGLGWQWRDATGYAPSHDLAALQKAMSDWVAGLSRIQGEAAFCLGRDHGTPGRIGPMGPLGPHFTLDDLHPWTEPGLTPATWARLLRAALWQGPWGRPMTASAEWQAQVVMQCAERASPLPEDLSAAMVDWRQSWEACPRPGSPGIGHRRGMLRQNLAPGLTMELPGLTDIVIEEGNPVFLHPDFTLAIRRAEIDAATPFPPSFPGPDIPLGDLVLRKGERARYGLSVALFRPRRRQVVILTLETQARWVFLAFDTWLATARASDLFA